mgnify:CR=1 FL=1
MYSQAAIGGTHARRQTGFFSFVTVPLFHKMQAVFPGLQPMWLSVGAQC